MPFGEDCEFRNMGHCISEMEGKVDDPESWCRALEEETFEECSGEDSAHDCACGEKAVTFAEFKAFKEIDPDGAGGFEGYGAVYGNRDLGGDVMRPGSVKNMDALVRDGFIGLNHGWDDLPIGYITEARQDSHGLWISTAYHAHEKAQTARRVAQERLAAGKTVGLSIGYSILPNGARNLPDGSRELNAVEVHEVSQVNAAMNPLAMVDAAKRGRPLANQSELAAASLADLADYVARTRSLADLRAKEGRVLSGANRTRLASLLEALNAVKGDIEKLLAETEPDKSLDPTVLMAEFLRIQSQALGVTI